MWVIQARARATAIANPPAFSKRGTRSDGKGVLRIHGPLGERLEEFTGHYSPLGKAQIAFRAPHPPAFSLTEMILVMTIITAMLVLLIPSLAQAFRQARSTLCKSNLREIGQGTQLYHMENDGWLPGSENGAPSFDMKPWFSRLFPKQVQDPRILMCPEDPLRGKLASALAEGREPEWSSYGISSFIVSAGNGFFANVDRHQTARPFGTILVGDIGPDHVAEQASANNPPGLGHRDLRRNLLYWDDGREPWEKQKVQSWLSARHHGAMNLLTLAGSIHEVPTVEIAARRIQRYYPACAAGGCTLCLEFNMPHYSFAEYGLYWWSGPLPTPARSPSSNP